MAGSNVGILNKLSRKMVQLEILGLGTCIAVPRYLSFNRKERIVFEHLNHDGIVPIKCSYKYI
jgi:hypothetical protein